MNPKKQKDRKYVQNIKTIKNNIPLKNNRRNKNK